MRVPIRRRAVSLLTALTFLVVAVTGVTAFIQPFSLGIIGLHALMGFVFVALVGLHVGNNLGHFTSYVRSRAFLVSMVATAVLTLLFWFQPAPIAWLLGQSGNLGPATERFAIADDGMVLDYSPSPEYRMRVTLKPGPAYDTRQPPDVAIWLENQGGYHIKTLRAPVNAAELPYWAFKHRGWEKAKREAEREPEPGEAIDAVTAPTPNGSFDPADYIVPTDSRDATRYSLLLEINRPGDDQPSLVYAVEIDNRLPRTFQLLELRGYPKRESDPATGTEAWPLFYSDASFGSALDLVDSGLVTIERRKGTQP